MSALCDQPPPSEAPCQPVVPRGCHWAVWRGSATSRAPREAQPCCRRRYTVLKAARRGGHGPLPLRRGLIRTFWKSKELTGTAWRDYSGERTKLPGTRNSHRLSWLNFSFLNKRKTKKKKRKKRKQNGKASPLVSKNNKNQPRLRANERSLGSSPQAWRALKRGLWRQ